MLEEENLYKLDHEFVSSILSNFGGLTIHVCIKNSDGLKIDSFDYFSNATKAVIPIYLMHKYCEQQQHGQWILDLFGLVNEVNPNLTLDEYKEKMYATYGDDITLGKGPKRVILYDDWLLDYNRVKNAIEVNNINFPFS